MANRGEIAVRVIRACREAGIRAAAVYSSADRGAPHVWMADVGLEIGPPAARESYLDGTRIVAAARRLGADAVHPGYGFLAENAEFAEAVTAAGLRWIGPPPQAIRAMGEKTAARRAMEAAGVPVVPGTVAPLADADAARAAARDLGYPLLLKAAAGGGGKGMRVVEKDGELAGAFAAAAREAASAFGDPAIYLERYLPSARHVEIQIVADAHGHVVHLGERECSLQRRHQKVVEESPAPGFSAQARAAMGAVAVRAAAAVGYVGAGTVEFLVTPEGDFYFLEMNTRLQVEHPVTEMVTGVDLVRLQLAVASGGPLPFGQDDVAWRGHAIECRIAAENAEEGFLPATGVVEEYAEPGGPGVRFDSGIAAGVAVTAWYDPLLAKCIAWGGTREEAVARMARALEETVIHGVATNVPFLRALLAEPAVREGRFDTRWLEAHAPRIAVGLAQARAADEPLAAALAALDVHLARRPPEREGLSADRDGAGRRWREAARFVWY